MTDTLAHEGPLRLALVTETFPPEINGVSMTIGRLVRGLAERGHRIEVIRPRQPGEKEGTFGHRNVTEILRPGVGIPRYQGLRLGLPSGGLLERRWKADPPDIVHVVTEGPLGWSALRAAERLGLPVSSSFHTNFHHYAKHYGIGLVHRLVSDYLRSFHNRTGVTMVPSSDLVKSLEADGYRGCALWSRGVDTELFTPSKRDPALRAKLGVSENGLLCIHVGRVAPEKSIPLAITAFRRIQAIRPDARMVLVGDGPLRAGLQRQNPDLMFTGAIDVDGLTRHDASADLFLFPSRSETFGNVLMESFASGTAAVGFDYAAAHMHGRDGVNMLAVAFDDEAGFLDAAVRAAKDDQLRSRLAVAARTTAEGIGWPAVVGRFEDLLRRVIIRSDSSGLLAVDAKAGQGAAA